MYEAHEVKKNYGLKIAGILKFWVEIFLIAFIFFNEPFARARARELGVGCVLCEVTVDEHLLLQMCKRKLASEREREVLRVVGARASDDN
jgi:hypothetical protein